MRSLFFTLLGIELVELDSDTGERWIKSKEDRSKELLPNKLYYFGPTSTPLVGRVNTLSESEASRSKGRWVLWFSRWVFWFKRDNNSFELEGESGSKVEVPLEFLKVLYGRS